MNNNNNTSVPSISSALIAASEHILHFSEAESPLCRLGKGTQRKLEVSSQCKRVMELHDQFLSMKKYKGVRLSILLAAHGDWTPAKEWSGVMTLEDRPKTIPPRTVQRFMEQARSYVRKHMKDDLNGPSL